jgi:hypothetical protein
MALATTNVMQHAPQSERIVKRTMLRVGEIVRDSFMRSQAGTYRVGFLFAQDEEGAEKDSLSPTEFVAE